MKNKLVSTLIAISAGILIGYLMRTWSVKNEILYSPSHTPNEIQSSISESDWYRLDPEFGLLHQSDAKRNFEWDEHPEKKFLSTTNNFGFRNDSPTTIEKPFDKKRILILGDSHIDGVVSNSESVAFWLSERRIDIEVLNGGVGHHSAQNYLWSLKRNLDLDIDIVITIVYAGNDFAESLVRFLTPNLPIRPPEYGFKLQTFLQISSATLSQGLNQSYLFKLFPELKSTAIDSVLVPLIELQKLAQDKKIKSYFFILPRKTDVEWESQAEILEKILKAADWKKEDLLQQQADLTNQFLARASLNGLTIVSAYEHFKKSSDEKYWKRDHHLNINGHRRLAELIWETIKTELQ